VKLKKLRKENRDDEVFLIADVEWQKYNAIWVSVPREYGEYLTDDRYDGFLVALLYPAMEYGENIEIDGKVSKRLLRNINKFVQDILLAYNSKLHRINITAKETTSETLPTAKHIGTGFSGGVDSFSTVYDNFVLESDLEYKIDTLVCLNVGSHGKYNKERTMTLFQSRYNFLKEYADTVNLPFIKVDSNIHLFHDKGGHQLTHTLTLTAGVLSIQKIFVRYYIASAGYNYNEWIYVAEKYRNYDIGGFSETYLLPLLSTETTEFILDGMQYTRVQKTINISKYPLTKQFLNVCLKNEPQKKNCGVCSKCARVGLTLSAVSKLDDYKDVFDIEVYKKNECMLMRKAVLTQEKNPFMRDIVDFARQNGKKYPNRFFSFAIIIFPYIQRNGIKKFFKAINRKIFGKQSG